MEDPRNSSSPTSASTSKNTGATPSKLMNRFKKKDHTETVSEESSFGNTDGKRKTATVNNVPDNPTTTSDVESKQEEIGAGDIGQSEWVMHQDELFNVKAERDELLMEKSFWLSKFQSDNASLLEILISTRDVKAKMLQEIDSLEKEKDRLRSLQLDGLESSLLDRVLDNSPLGTYFNKCEYYFYLYIHFLFFVVPMHS